MSSSHELARDDEKLFDYLLGQLPEGEAERLDEASIVNDALACRLREVENDLVDAYVSGTLARARRAPFEVAYLASPRRREKVEFARRFLAAVDRAPQTPVPALRSRAVWSLQAAAAALLLACGVLLYEDVRLHSVMNVATRRIGRAAAAGSSADAATRRGAFGRR